MRFLVSQVRLDFMGRVSPVEKKVYVVSPWQMLGQVAQFLPQQKEPEGIWGLVELKGSLAVTSKSRRLGERRKATTGGCWKTLLHRWEESNKLKCFLMIWEMWGSDGLKVVINGIRLGLLMSLVCKVSWRGMSAARRICLLTKLRL